MLVKDLFKKYLEKSELLRPLYIRSLSATNEKGASKNFIETLKEAKISYHVGTLIP